MQFPTLIPQLIPLGWTQQFENEYLSLEKKNQNVGRVVQVERGHYRVGLGTESFVTLELAGKLLHDSQGAEDLPAIGDFVTLRLTPDGKAGQITGVLARKSCLKRQAAGKAVQTQIFAANIDFVFIVTSANEDFKVRRMERYLSMVWDSGAEPVILLNKIDLSAERETYITQLEKISFNSPIICLSALHGEGVSEVESFLRPGKTAVVVGSSGVGKSTLTNVLIGQEVAPTRDIRPDDDKGRHTTTSRSLYILPQGGLLIDTPGIRQLQLNTSEEALGQSFRDIDEIALRCHFTDCTHQQEEGCKIREALETKIIDQARWRSYQKLLKEQRSLEIRKDPVKLREQKQKWKQIHKGLKQKNKLNKKS